MITLEDDRLVFRFPEIHTDAQCSIELQRTLRIPDDGMDYPLPPGMGRFPLRHLDDFAQRVTPTWLRRGGVLMPMHQAEAIWLNFDCGAYPFAVKVATGKICALTGETWINHLNSDPQDYVVLPEQPWLDGYCVAEGIVRQFVAMPLGQGYTVEEQLTGDAEHGGLQLIAYPMKAERYEDLMSDHVAGAPLDDGVAYSPVQSASMGLAPGGRMQQDIYDDPYGLDAWDQRHASRCFVTIANSVQWMALTGERPPTEPPTARQYAAAGLPWFEYFGGDLRAMAGSDKLRAIASVAEIGAAKGEAPLAENDSMVVDHMISIRRWGSNQVREISAEETSTQ